VKNQSNGARNAGSSRQVAGLGEYDGSMDEHILVVDDNRDAADGLARLIAGFGYPVKAVYDGKQAVAVAATFSPDMALIDIGMPGLDGYETVAQIRMQRAAAQVILVAVTGRSGEEDKQRAYECGFDLYEPKPLSVERLKELLRLLDPEAE
jgi:two-component system, sensor histidine kinase